MNKGVQNTAFYLTQIAISGVLMLALMPIVAHQLTPGELGQFVLVQVYSGIAVGIANLGMLAAYERNFFIYETSDTKSAQLISSALMFVSVNLLLLVSIIYVYQIEISKLILSNVPPNNLLFIVLIGSSAASLAQYYLTFLKNSGLAKRFAQFMLIKTVFYCSIVILLLFLTNLKVLSLAYAWLFSNVLLFVMLVLIYNRNLSLSFSKEMLRAMLKISIPLTPTVFFGFINTQFDKIMLGFVNSTSSVGIYNIGQTLSLTIFQFMTGLGRVFQPEVYRKLFQNEHSLKPHAINIIILPFFYVSIFFALLVAIFAKEFVTLFFPADYFEATGVVIILSIYYASLFFGKISGPQLLFEKKTYMVTLLTLVGILINVGLNIPFILKWGIIGAAWATTIAGILITTIGYFVAQRYAKIVWKWKLYFLLYAIFLLSVICALIDYNNLIDVSGIIIITVKFSLISLYIFIGFKLAIINRSMIKFKRYYDK